MDPVCLCLSVRVNGASLFLSRYFAIDGDGNRIYEGGSLENEADV